MKENLSRMVIVCIFFKWIFLRNSFKNLTKISWTI